MHSSSASPNRPIRDSFSFYNIFDELYLARAGTRRYLNAPTSNVLHTSLDAYTEQNGVECR